LISGVGGYHAGRPWTSWVQPSAGRIKLEFTSSANNCCPDGSGGLNCTGTCSTYPNFAYRGVTMQGYEYQRYENGATPFWTPLRFPGQYHDIESDLFENWNRYYDPQVGRYLQPEPMLENPEWLRFRAEMGESMPAYSYALNNPIAFVDPDGRAGKPGPGGAANDNKEGPWVPKNYSECMELGFRDIDALEKFYNNEYNKRLDEINRMSDDPHCDPNGILDALNDLEEQMNQKKKNLKKRAEWMKKKCQEVFLKKK
jgi:RHS repeat-associated protein